ncbi:hypothetical protein [Rhizobium tumorigenes]|uniref:hypothetical protein n=1 Tax=Rhizobium tumorigenes TaxID=2041385 RepID=UPI00241E97CD|nr:hypothetical protein [Rhizobium tumorigenes]WFS03249.1 hypothetical protein PR016_21595 [Rhizobium tumorigenes]
MMPLVQQFITQRKKDWSPAMVEDPAQEGLLAMIADKRAALKLVKKGKPAASPPFQPASLVINIMDALRRRIEANGSGKRACARGPIM